MKAKLIAVAIFSALLSTTAWADLSCSGSYGFRVDVDGVTGNTICASKAQDIIDAAKDFKNSNHNYTSRSAAIGEGRFNDVDFTVSYDANSTTLTFQSDDINISQSFTGTTRKKTEDEFEDWMKHSGIMSTIMQYQAKNSTASPITGASGLMPSLATTDYATGMDGSSNIVSSIATETSSSDSSDTDTESSTVNNNNNNGTINLLGAGLTVGTYKISDTNERVTSTTLPLSYSIGTNANDPRSQLIISVPLTMYTVGSSRGYHVGLGLAHRFGITENWTLTPGIRYSVTGSVDRATVAAVYSGSLMSTYRIPLNSFDLNIGNMIGYYKTGKFSAGDYSFNPNIKQIMLRNGVMLSQPIQIKDKKLALEYSIIDTRYVGSDKPFMKDMQEFGLTLGSHKNQKGKLSFLRAGMSYIHSKGSNGVTFNFGYWF